MIRPRLVVLGEAWGEREAELRRPFVGACGVELTRMLTEAMPPLTPAEGELQAHIWAGFYLDSDPRRWIEDRDEWLALRGIVLANVFSLHPPGNKIESLCITGAERGKDYPPLAPISRGCYLAPRYFDEARRALVEIAEWGPNLVLALGNTATWLMLEATNIGSIRGAVAVATPNPFLGRVSTKVLPTYHPAGVLRNWSWRPIVLADMMKARRECEHAGLRRPQRRIIVNPSMDEIALWVMQTFATPPPTLACDVETRAGQITCIGFARSRGEALVIPFADSSKPGNSYWPSVAIESTAWGYVAALLESSIPKVFQNGLYDLQYITPMGILPRQLSDDTMLLHHSLFPELQKGLGFLGSIYTDEASWKLMRRKRPDTEKRDE